MQREEELWKRLPIGSELREAAAVVCSGTHARVGCASPLRVLARVPEMVRAIMYARVGAPIIIPDDYASLQEAANVAFSGGSILIRQGLHLLTMSQTSFSPTKIEKELHIFGQAGAVLVGGLHMGMESCGSLRNLEIRGHLWVYDGLWEISNCTILNNIKDACVVVSNFGQAHFKECEIGGLRQARSHHGLIQYGDSMVCLENCEVYLCRLAVTLGNNCKCWISACDLKDCDIVFACMQGGTGVHLEVQDSEIARSGVVWKDGRRPPNVISRGNTVNRESLGEHYWTSPSPWGDWGALPGPSDLIADGDYVVGVVGDEVEALATLTLQELHSIHPEAVPMDIS